MHLMPPLRTSMPALIRYDVLMVEFFRSININKTVKVKQVLGIKNTLFLTDLSALNIIHTVRISSDRAPLGFINLHPPRDAGIGRVLFTLLGRGKVCRNNSNSLLVEANFFNCF